MSMKFICYVRYSDLSRLSSAEGLTKADELSYVSFIQSFLRSFGIDYIRPFVCFTVMPDFADPADSTRSIAVFGEVPLVLRPEIGLEVMIACQRDLQTTAYNGWKKRRGMKPPAEYLRMLTDLRYTKPVDKIATLARLAGELGQGTYPEARIYRAITWKDVDCQCRKEFEPCLPDPSP
jgi:hypothetical protein